MSTDYFANSTEVTDLDWEEEVELNVATIDKWNDMNR